VEFYPVNGAIVKVYSDFSAAPKNASGDYNRSALSVFAGFKGKRYRLAAE